MTRVTNQCGSDMKNHYVIRWNKDRPLQAFKLALLGATDKQIADVMGVDINTLDYWKRTKQSFREMLNEGKMKADAEIAASFFKRARGYTYKEERTVMVKGKPLTSTVTRHVPADSWAAHKWLSLRQREKWADVQRTEIMQTNVNIMKLDLTGLSTEELMLVKKLGLKQLEAHVTDN